MVTPGLGGLVILGILGLVFALICVRLGALAGYLAASWVPVIGLLLGLAFRDRLGLSLLVVDLLVLLAIVVLVAMGVRLTLQARRAGSALVGQLAWATLLAALPLVVCLVVAFRTKGS